MGVFSRPCWTGSTILPTQVLSVLFSPNGGCTDVTVAVIATARKSVDVQAYSFMSTPIA
jgi:hypothetical protein